MKWEYMVKQITAKPTEAERETNDLVACLNRIAECLNGYGEHGWEVCGIASGCVYVFKRPVRA